MPIRELVENVYAALGTGDRAALLELLAPDFQGVISEGMPGGLGGRKDGAEQMIDDGWWQIGRRYAVRPEPREWVPAQDGRLLVVGTYRGTSRADGHEVDAAFAHLWSERDGRLCALEQITDTGRW